MGAFAPINLQQWVHCTRPETRSWVSKVLYYLEFLQDFALKPPKNFALSVQQT